MSRLHIASGWLAVTAIALLLFVIVNIVFDPALAAPRRQTAATAPQPALSGSGAGTPTPTVPQTPPATSTIAATATPTVCGTVGNWIIAAPGPLDVYGPASTSDGSFAYFAGGYSFSGGGDSVQFSRYSHFTNTWTTLAPVPNGFSTMGSAIYDPVGNRIFVFGGLNTASGTTTNVTRIYNISSNTWGAGAPMPDVRAFMASGYDSGNAYLIGGYSTGSFTSTFAQVWQYNISANTWLTKTAMPQALGGAGSAVINGHLYVAGGRDASGTVLSSLYDYDIATDSWATRTSMPSPDNVPGAAVLGGDLYIIGGGNPTDTRDPRAFAPDRVDATNATVVYQPGPDSWHIGPNLNVRRSFPGSATTGNKAVAYGGYTGTTTTATTGLLVFTPCATSTPTSTPLPTGTPTMTSTPTSTPPPTGTPTMTATPTSTPSPSDTPLPTVTPTDCPNPFVDITANIFYQAIHYLNCRSVVNGIDPTHYSPAGTSTRGQFAKVVVLGFGLALTTPASGPDFVDVPSSYFAYVYIETGYAAGILSGFDPATCAAHNLGNPCYLPNQPITRGQLTRLVVNAGGYALYTPSSGQDFSDVPPSNVFYASIETAYHDGIINGYPGGIFLPNNDIRRDEMAQIVYAGIAHRP